MDSPIVWVKGKDGYTCCVTAPKIGQFSVNYWPKKSTANLQGKNSKVAKQEIVKRLIKEYPGRNM